MSVSVRRLRKRLTEGQSESCLVDAYEEANVMSGVVGEASNNTVFFFKYIFCDLINNSQNFSHSFDSF